MRISALHPRSAAALRAALRQGWAHPIHAEVVADHGRHGKERQLAELRPWGNTGDVTVSCCSVGGHYSAQTLARDPDPRTAPSQQAVRMLATFFFGGQGLLPRIVGPVEWQAASLAMRYVDDDEPGGGLLRLNIRPLEGAQRMASCRLEQDGAPKAFLLFLRPADADPLYALLRVALGIDVDHGFTA